MHSQAWEAVPRVGCRTEQNFDRFELEKAFQIFFEA